MGWVSSTHCHSKLPPANKNPLADNPPATNWPYMVNFKLHLYFPGWVGVGVVIIKLKANLGSTGTGVANWNWAWQNLLQQQNNLLWHWKQQKCVPRQIEDLKLTTEKCLGSKVTWFWFDFALFCEITGQKKYAVFACLFWKNKIFTSFQMNLGIIPTQNSVFLFLSKILYYLALIPPVLCAW